ncbi:MAG: ABC transporter permease [Anaerolineae bacterium]|nr:MAG: ABC transporter permease [Anaerolineae bacterium]
MKQYILRRLILSIPVLIGILIATFAIARLIPGDPCTAALGERATVEVCEAFNKRMGLDQPIYIQLGIYMRDVLTGNLGDSIRFSRPVFVIVVEKLPVTLELGIVALALAVLVGVPAGILSAIKRNSPIDIATMIGANVGVSMPVYWLGLMLAYLFAVLLKDTPFWLPPSGRLTAGLSATPFYEAWGLHINSNTFGYPVFEFISNLFIVNSIITLNFKILGDTLKHLILPATALSTIPMSIIARITRSSMLEVLGQDYIRTARAKGLLERLVITRHALRNALLPIITIIGLQVGTLFAGAVLTETIFSLSGVGRSLFDAITGRDFPVIQGFTVIIAMGYVGVNLLTDIAYAMVDPRIKLD